MNNNDNYFTPCSRDTFRRVTVPSCLGDEKGEYAPKNGDYNNAIVFYEASNAVFLYSSDGIPTKLTSNVAGIKALAYKDQADYVTDVINKPTIPTKTSDITNDSGFIDNTYHDNSKQDTLVSGTNIKTINSQSLLGSGDITISGGSENWELINTVTVTEDVQNILINQDTNGNGFELKKIFLNVTTKPSTGAPTTRYNMRVYTGLYSTRRQVTSVDNIVTKQQAFIGATENFMMQINLESLVRVGNTVYTGATLIGETITQGYNPRFASETASRLLLNGYTFVELEAVNASSIFGVGSEIELYGVRV